MFKRILEKESDEIKNKFKSLECYFESIEIEDLDTINPFNFIEYAKPERKGLMDLFVNKYIFPFLEQEHEDNDVFIIIDIDMHKEKDVLIIDNINEEIHLKTIKFININTADLENVYIFIKNKEEQLNNCVILLNNNRIHGIQGNETKTRRIMDELCSIKNVSFVNIIDNPFVSIDHTEYFNNLNEVTANKLIFIHLWDLKADFWKQMIIKNYETVIQNHKLYYNK